MCVWPHSLPGGGGRDSLLFLSKSSAAWVFSLSSWSSQTTGSHLTRFVFIHKRREAGARCHRRPLTPAATKVCFASSAAVPRARAFPWLLLYELPFCSKLITHSIEKEKTTQLEGCLTHAHSHIPKCVSTHAHKLRVYTTPYHTHMHTIYKYNPPRKYYIIYLFVPHYTMHTTHIYTHRIHSMSHAITYRTCTNETHAPHTYKLYIYMCIKHDTYHEYTPHIFHLNTYSTHHTQCDHLPHTCTFMYIPHT